jgi:hypothetical protein
MALKPIDMVKEITYHKSNLDFDDPEVYAAYNIFLINKFLSSIDFLLPFVDMVNKSGLEKKDHYLFFKALIPRANYPVKFLKKEVDGNIEENIMCLCHHLEIGQREAREYLPFLSPDQTEKLRAMYRYGKNGKSSAIEEF